MTERLTGTYASIADDTPWWAAPVMSYSSNYRQEFRPVTSTKEAEVAGSGFVNLLNEQIKKAEKAMKEELKQQLLYGRTYKPNPELRKAIDNAYDSTIGVSTFDKVLTEEYMNKIRDSVFSESPIMKYLKDNKEKAEMSTTVEIVRKAVEQKKKEKAENLVEYLTSFFDQGEFADGDTIGWNATFPNNDKVYRYAAIKSGGRWYITNRNGDFDDMEMVEIISTLAIDGTVVMDGDEDPL